MINEEKTKIAIEYLTELRDSRQKVLPNEAPHYEAEKDMDMFNIAIKALENERPQDEWIPVGERLPEGKIDPMTNDFELVLCLTVWEVVRPYKFGKPIGHSKAHFWSGGGIMDDFVIAWQPLPEPYKEAENGN